MKQTHTPQRGPKVQPWSSMAPNCQPQLKGDPPVDPKPQLREDPCFQHGRVSVTQQTLESTPRSAICTSCGSHADLWRHVHGPCSLLAAPRPCDQPMGHTEDFSHHLSLRLVPRTGVDNQPLHPLVATVTAPQFSEAGTGNLGCLGIGMNSQNHHLCTLEGHDLAAVPGTGWRWPHAWACLPM